jgi:hypothetical protein
MNGDAIAEFLRALRDEGFRIGVEECLRAARILESTQDSESLPARLAPVLAKDPAQWERFFQLYRTYFEATSPMETPVRAAAEQRQRSRRTDTQRTRLLFFAVILVAGIGYVAVLGLGPSHPVQSVGAALQTALRVLEPLTRTGLSIGLPWGIALISALIVLVAFYRFYRRPVSALSVSAAAVGGPRAEAGGAVESFFDPLGGRWLAIDMLRLQPTESVSFDLTRTLDATIRSPWDTPLLYSPSRRTPRYLVLIDRRYPGDHLSILISTLMERLRAEHVEVAAYHFSGDPRICRDSAKGVSVYLGALASLYPDSKLVLFGDGQAFVSAMDGRLEPWMTVFQNWKEAWLFAPPI